MNAGVKTAVSSGAVTAVTLNSPFSGIALDDVMVEKLHEIVDTATHDGTRLLPIEAEGKTFSAGLNLHDLKTETDASLGQSMPVHGRETCCVVGIYRGVEKQVSHEKPRSEGR